MRNILIYPVGCTPASHAAVRALADSGIDIADHITPEATHLLMDAPSFSGNGLLKSGANLQELLALLPEHITLIGGMLPEEITGSHPAIDLLKDDLYLWKNAALTAECALRVAGEKISFSLCSAPVLVIGWGRIGKQLAFLLKAHGAEVAVLSRSIAHRAEATSFGLRSIAPEALADEIHKYRILFNTAPGIMVPRPLAAECAGSLKIDLASTPGIEAADVIQARGLPGIHVPESAGRLIADTVIRLTREDGV
mgnify:FL=1